MKSKKEKDWSKLAVHFDKLQEYIVGNEVMDLLKCEFDKLNDLGYLLELGCGNGTYTKMIEHATRKILATDYSGDMVKAAKKKLNDYKNIEIQQADCYDLKFPDSTFDSIQMANLIHVVADPQKAIDEVHRVLKTNGTLVVTSFTMDGMTFFNKIMMIYKYLKTVGKPPTSGTRFGLKSLTEFIAKNGFKVKESKLVGNTSKAIYIVARKNEK
jgi:ubiquinone/menaquinone biosynthesis C-methylase UbiE